MILRWKDILIKYLFNEAICLRPIFALSLFSGDVYGDVRSQDSPRFTAKDAGLALENLIPDINPTQSQHTQYIKE